MRSTQSGAMQDVCRVGAYQSVANTYGNPAPEWIYGAEVACGLEHVNPREVQASGEVPVIDARLRLPIATAIDERDRIRIEKRFGESLTDPQIFEIEGPVKQGPSGLVLGLRLVDDGSGTPHGV